MQCVVCGPSDNSGCMIPFLLRLSSGIDQINEWIGRLIAWLTGALVLLIGYDVLMRKLFAFTRVWISELEWHIFAVIFLLGAAYTLLHDQHVRVDVFYSRFSPKRKAWINLLGTLIFLLPFGIIMLWTGWDFVERSWRIGEISAEPNGLPARYLVKSTILIGFILLCIQAISLLAKSIVSILQDSPTSD